MRYMIDTCIVSFIVDGCKFGTKFHYYKNQGLIYIMSDEVILSVAKDFQSIFEGIGKSSLIEETVMDLTPTARIPLA